MALRIEDYALIGDTQTAALVGVDGSIDWLCLPRFDSGACFAALLGDEGNGRWMIRPADAAARGRRRYRPGTLVLETTFSTAEGEVRVVDCMPPRGSDPDVVRVVEGVRGSVPMCMRLVVRFDYGSTTPWVQRKAHGLSMIAGPDALTLRADVPVRGEDFTTVAEFTVSAGQRVGFVLTWSPSNGRPPRAIDAHDAVTETELWWRSWSARYHGPEGWRDAVVRSLITLKALIYAPTGGIVAAPTTSLPEALGGVRNWDYRYCWLRDATFTLLSLMEGGYIDEAREWRDWLLRAAAGSPHQLQIMYGPAGERRLPELELPWLAGYEGSRPVRIGNAASQQRQLDVYGEVMDALYLARVMGIQRNSDAWALQRALLDFLEGAWREPDEGIWEVRGGRRHFTHSKVMAWVAADRAVRSVEEFGLPGPVDRWRSLREEIHREVCAHGYDADRGAFVQHYGSRRMDASLLVIPLVGFLPAGDPRVRGTVEAIERELCQEGFVARYVADEEAVDGLPPGEGAFLPCSFWLVDNLWLLGRQDEARRLLERLLDVRNDVGLLAEEYDVARRRQLGNFPQAFSHVGLINSVRAIAGAGPARIRVGRVSAGDAPGPPRP